MLPLDLRTLGWAVPEGLLSRGHSFCSSDHADLLLRAHLSTISNSSIMEDLPLPVEAIMEDLHNPLLEATQVSSSSISSTTLICSSSRPCTTTPSMLCRCSSTTQVWDSSTLEAQLLLHQCTRDHLERSSQQSETIKKLKEEKEV